MASLPEFRNEPYTDFSTPANRKAMAKALATVRSQFGREYELRKLAGERLTTEGEIAVVESVQSERGGGNSSESHHGDGAEGGGVGLRVFSGVGGHARCRSACACF